MVINNLNFFSITSTPHKADLPLTIYSYAVLSLSIPLQGFEPI